MMDFISNLFQIYRNLLVGLNMVLQLELPTALLRNWRRKSNSRTVDGPMTDLAPADEQKIISGCKKFGRGGKN